MATLPARFCMALVSLCLALLFAQPSSAERSKARRMSTPPTVHSNTWKQVKSRPTIVALHPYPAIRKAYKLLFGIEDESKVLALLLRSNTMAVEMQWIPLTEIEPNSAAVAVRQVFSPCNRSPASGSMAGTSASHSPSSPVAKSCLNGSFSRVTFPSLTSTARSPVHRNPRHPPP